MSEPLAYKRRSHDFFYAGLQTAASWGDSLSEKLRYFTHEAKVWIRFGMFFAISRWVRSTFPFLFRYLVTRRRVPEARYCQRAWTKAMAAFPLFTSLSDNNFFSRYVTNSRYAVGQVYHDVLDKEYDRSMKASYLSIFQAIYRAHCKLLCYFIWY